MFANPSVSLGAIVAYLALGTFASPVPGEGGVALEARNGWLGGIDVNLACQIQNGDDWSAVRTGSSCSSWKCQLGDRRTSVNMSAACASQYLLMQAYAGCGGDVYAWACYLD